MMLDTTFRPTVVVLATGRGARFFGTDRPERSLEDGSVLATTLRHALASGLPVLVVATSLLEPTARALVAAQDVVVLPCLPQEPPGMGHSIAAGVSARPDASGWVILPADMPLVHPHTLCAVAQALSVQAVAYAQDAGRRGHPVGFAAELYSELVQLNSSLSARRLVARYPSVGVDVDDPGTQIDVDTLEELQALHITHQARLGVRVA